MGLCNILRCTKYVFRIHVLKNRKQEICHFEMILQFWTNFCSYFLISGWGIKHKSGCHSAIYCRIRIKDHVFECGVGYKHILTYVVTVIALWTLFGPCFEHDNLIQPTHVHTNICYLLWYSLDRFNKAAHGLSLAYVCETIFETSEDLKMDPCLPEHHKMAL